MTADLPIDPFLSLEEIGVSEETHELARRMIQERSGRDIGPWRSVLLLRDNPKAPS